MRTTKILVALALTMSVCGQSLADMSSFGFTEGNLSARAEFFANGDTLVVRLFNTATTDVQNPGHVLTGLFFDIIGYTGTGLTTVSALLFDLSGTPVLFPENTTQPGTGYNNFAGAGDIGSEIAYKLGGAGNGLRYFVWPRRPGDCPAI